MEHLDVLDAPWKQDDDRAIEDYRKRQGCFVCGAPEYKRAPLAETVPLGEYLCPDCKRAYELGLKHGQRFTEGQLLEHDPQW